MMRTTKGPEFARLLGLGVARGENLVTNDDVAGPIDSSDEWIRQRTGIVTRVRAKPETSVIDLAEKASRDAIAAAGIEGAEIDTIILSTITYPHMTPAGAPILAEPAWVVRTAAAFDISAACAGYCYGIAQADALVRSGQSRYVLVIGAEKMSDFIDPTDRSISFLLGDGAGAVVVGPSDTPGIGPTVWGSKGEGADLVGMTASWLDVRDERHPLPHPSSRKASRSSSGRRSRCPRSPRRRSRPPASHPRTFRPSSPTRRTCGSSTRWPSGSACPTTSPSGATSPTPATRRRRPSLWRRSVCSVTAR